MPKKKGGSSNPHLSLPFVATIISLVLLLGFVVILSQMLELQDFLYEQFNRSHDQIEALRLQIEDLKR